MLTPMVDPSRAGLTVALDEGAGVVAAAEDVEAGSGELVVQQDLLGRHLVDGDARGEDAAAGVGDAEQLEQTLHRPVLAVAAVQSDEGDLRPRRGQLLRQVASGVDADGLVPLLLQGAEDRPAGAQGDLPLGRKPAHQDGDCLLSEFFPRHGET